ncbi:MAG TPA: hypothetical protein VLB00_15075 [Gemmatimonadales bacterium]|nr:hypothetical protein [Gemmatimonadales bacterium]
MPVVAAEGPAAGVVVPVAEVAEVVVEVPVGERVAAVRVAEGSGSRRPRRRR